MATHHNLILTPHERLFLAGQLNQFEICVLTDDKSGMIDILRKVDLDSEQACNFAEQVLADPGKFGYSDGGNLIH